MNKKTKMYLGLGVVAVAGYYIWMKSKTPATKVNFKGGYDGTPCSFISLKTHKNTMGQYHPYYERCFAKNGDSNRNFKLIK
jgi:hypothetical protein